MDRSPDWLAQAHRDLARAEIDVQYEFWEWACFTSQQAAEKGVKALLLSRGLDAWGHAITPLMRGVGVEVPDDVVAAGQLLDLYYIPTRYPNGFAAGIPADYFSRQKAQEAIDSARTILRFCEANLA
jgi:HEPN domain-containing protein